MRTEGAAVGDVVEPIQDATVRAEPGDAERNDDRPTAIPARGLHVGADATLGLGAALGPVLAQGLALDMSERAELVQTLGPQSTERYPEPVSHSERRRTASTTGRQWRSAKRSSGTCSGGIRRAASRAADPSKST